MGEARVGMGGKGRQINQAQHSTYDVYILTCMSIYLHFLCAKKWFKKRIRVKCYFHTHFVCISCGNFTNNIYSSLKFIILNPKLTEPKEKIFKRNKKRQAI